jgi:hypothetical protein
MKRAALLAALQIGVILGWAGQNEYVRAHAPTFRIPLNPRDPYDVLRGRYFVLNPRDSRIRTADPDTPLPREAVERFLAGEKFFGRRALVGFCPQGEVHRVCGLRRTEEGPGEGFWAPALVVIGETPVYPARTTPPPAPSPGWDVDVDLDLTRFYLPNRFVLPGRESEQGWELEVSHRRRQPLLPKRLWFQGRPVRTED